MSRPCKYSIDYEDAVNLLCKEKLSIPLAADKLNCTYDALRTFIEKHDIKLPPAKDRVKKNSSPLFHEDSQVIQALLCNKLTFRQIAEKYNCTESSVSEFVKQHQLAVYRYNADPDKEELQKLYCDELYTFKQLSSHFRVSEDRIRKCLDAHSITRTPVQQRKAQVMRNEAVAASRRQIYWSNLPDVAVLGDEILDSSLRAVCDKYSVSEDSVRSYFAYFDAKLPSKLDPPDVTLLQTLLNQGLFLSEIGERVNRSEATVSKWIKTYDLHRSDEGDSIVRSRRAESSRTISLSRSGGVFPSIEELQSCIDNYMNFTEIASLYGCSSSAISNYAKQNSISFPEDYENIVVKNYIGKGRRTVLDTYGVFPYALSKYNKKAQEVLTDRQFLEQFIQAIPLKERTWSRVAADLQVPIYLVKNYYQRYSLCCEFSPTLGSSLEEQLRRFLDTYQIEYSRNNRTVISPQEIDFYFEEFKLGIEVNGNWSHSVDSVGKYNALDINYHLNKTNKCRDAGVNLIHLFEYEMNNTTQWHKLQSFLKDRLSVNTCKLFARKCQILKVSKQLEKAFLNEFHLQNYVASSVCYGLFYNDELVMLMSFGKPRFSGNYQYELIRLCTRFGTRVVGGAERLFNHFIRNNEVTSVVSYCDLSKFTGNVYERLGMNLVRKSPPNYKWAKYGVVYSRYQTQKHRLAHILGDNYDDSMSEADNMYNNGFVRLYDCGNAVYEWRK